MNDAPPFAGDLADALGAIRQEIDSIDHQILALIAKRMQRVSNIADQKIQQGLVFRARRERQKIRALQEIAASYSLDSTMVFDLWRILMSHAAYQQRPFQLLHLGEVLHAEIASRHFGQTIHVEQSGSLEELLDRQQAMPDGIMCLFDKQRSDWWQAVSERENLHIVAELPWRGDAAPECYLLAHCPVDLEANADTLCLLDCAKDTPIPEDSQLESVLGAQILGKRHDPPSGRWLVRVRDEPSYPDLETLQQRFSCQLTGGWTSRWLGRLAVFHHRQPEA